MDKEGKKIVCQRLSNIFPPGQMVVPVTTIMAKGTINGDHRRPWKNAPYHVTTILYWGAQQTETIIYGLSVTINGDHFPNNLVYIQITTNGDHRRPYSVTEIWSLFVVIFMYLPCCYLRRSYAGQWAMFVISSCRHLWFLTNKYTLKLGHIVNWGHQFHLQTQFWPLRLFGGCSDLGACQNAPYHIRNMHTDK